MIVMDFMSEELLLRSEIIQRREEGYNVRNVEKQFLSLLDAENALDERLDSLWVEFESLQVVPVPG